MAYSGAFGGRDREAERLVSDTLPEREAAPVGRERGNGGRERGSFFDLGSLLKKTEAAGMETDDLLMALVLYLMYRESGDTDLLIMLGVMLLT